MEHMNIVIIGHVDHGKSTVVGRLLADTGSVPPEKIQAVRELCRNTAKPFEYAFLLDALKDERSQGITIDSARCFFKSRRREYIIIDAPGHVEFLKNMISGAARAEAALIVIDAREGIQENSRRHGYLASLLGINQICVLVNKMDLIAYDHGGFTRICREYGRFLQTIGVQATAFIPVSARNGDMITAASATMPWYEGKTVLEQLDALVKEPAPEHKPLRFPLQDIYKFTEQGDDRRILAGTVACGSVAAGDAVLFMPSRKEATVSSLERFNAPESQQATAGQAIGITVAQQIYARPGELLCRRDEPLPHVSRRFKANIFWLGRSPMVPQRRYKLKLATARAMVELVEIVSVIDASDLSTDRLKRQIDRHDTAECIFETTKPLAFDLVGENAATSRFVVIDNYEIAGGGIITACLDDTAATVVRHVREREQSWVRGLITPRDREQRNRHRAKCVVLTGGADSGKNKVAQLLEQYLFGRNYQVYYLSAATLAQGLDIDLGSRLEDREEFMRRLGELARILTDAGQIFIATVTDIDIYDVEILKLLNAPNEILTIGVGGIGCDQYQPDACLRPELEPAAAVQEIVRLLAQKDIVGDYCI